MADNTGRAYIYIYAAHYYIRRNHADTFSESKQQVSATRRETSQTTRGGVATARLGVRRQAER